MSNQKYEKFGVMLDCSRNAVLKVSAVKQMIDCLAKMGYNVLELYTEDTYEVENEPFMGYLRGRYSSKEIKEIDAYAQAKGIELIPCIQTLAHFSAFVKNGEINRKEFMTEIKRFVLVAVPYSDKPAWYLDEEDRTTVGSTVEIDYGMHQDVQGVVVQVLRCDKHYPPYGGRIYPIREIVELKEEKPRR